MIYKADHSFGPSMHMQGYAAHIDGVVSCTLRNPGTWFGEFSGQMGVAGTVVGGG